MGGSYSNSYGRNCLVRSVPFNIHIPLSLRDPKHADISIEVLQRLGNATDVRNIALEYIHNDTVFASVWNSNTISPQIRRWLRILVQIQTINAVGNSFYRLPDDRRIELDNEKMIRAAQYSKLYENEYHYNIARQSRRFSNQTKIFVVNGDCLDTVRYFTIKYPDLNPVVLNMANAYSPGGGWRNGCGAQEENLHRRTNLFQCLEDSYNQLEGQRNWHYPIPEFGGIYSPKVSVFRGSESQGYPFFPHGPEYISFIAAAAYARPSTKLNKNNEVELSNKKQIINTKKKIDAIFKIALDNQHDTIILSAFGCGAFGNPPKHIARLFHEMISERYSHSFRYLIFAIIEDHNSMHRHNPNGNIQPFADVFQTTILFPNQI